jgi:hypothetical protein
MHPEPGHHHRPRRLAAVAALVAAALVTAACGNGSGSTVTPEAGGKPAGTGTPVPAATTPAPATRAPSTGATRRTATSQLRPFVTAARTADTRLHRAALLINGGISATQITVTPATVKAVKAVWPPDVARRVPAGMDPQLKRATLLVYSDIASRRWAMEPVTYGGAAGLVLPRPGPASASPSADEVLAALRNGHAAADRFEADLAALQALAARTPAFAVPGRASRAAAEMAVREAYIDGWNAGCGGTGGKVFTQLAPLTWTGGQPGRYTGAVGPVAFVATLQAGGGWQVSLNAC